jgi:MFS family permease
MWSAVTSCWALLLGITFLLLGSGLHGSLLGIRASLEGFPTLVTGLIMSGYYVGFVAGSMVTPRLVARVGHVRVFAALACLASTTVLAQAVLVEPATWAGLRLATGFCYAGLYVVTESWLNARASNALRGRLLAVYVALCLIGMALGQLLLNLADPGGAELFILVAALISFGVVPMLLSTGPAPAYEAPVKVRLRRLLSISPLGVFGLFGTTMVHGAFFGMGAVYGAQAGFSVASISLFMSAMMLGGIVLQWPIGWLSDAFDRRRVITLVTLLAAIFALAAALANTSSAPALLLLMVALFGGMALPMYSLCLAHANDYLKPAEMVQASASLILVAGLGAALGPASAALAMAALGPPGFFLWLAAIHGAIGGFALWRMTRRAGPAPEDQGAFVALPPRATPAASALYAEVAAERAAGAGEKPVARLT